MAVQNSRARRQRRALLACLALIPLSQAGPALALPFLRVPSGSMQPILRPGDVVTAWGYGRSRPGRGDIAAFRPTFEPDRIYLKRVVGLPGERIQMIDGVLHIEGAAVRLEPLGQVEVESYDGRMERVEAYRETLPGGVSYSVLDTGETRLDNTRVFVVPDRHYFVMGDHRDNSDDSRLNVGFVPIESFVGRVHAIIRGGG